MTAIGIQMETTSLTGGPDFDVVGKALAVKAREEPKSKPLDREAAYTFLEEGGQVLKQRAQLRDAANGERSMAKTVAIFNAWTGNNLSVQDGWRFMLALKQAREIQGSYNRDDYVDGANYFALLGEEESANEQRRRK